MTDDELWSEIIRWTRDALGNTVPVIRAYQDANRPALPYVMINFLGSRSVRDHEQLIEWSSQFDPETDDPDDPVTATPHIETEWHYSIHAFGDVPTDILRPLKSAAKLMQMNESLYPGVIIHDLSQIRNVPEYVNQAWEPRANVDIFLRGLTKDGFIVDPIDDISIEIQRQG